MKNLVKNLTYFMFLFFIMGSVSASVIINQTRVIYPSDAKNVTVQLINKSKTEHLVQSWIDDGSPQARPEEMRLPLLVSPPVVKVTPSGGQLLKIAVSGSTEKLPEDRESVFWLNILDIPPMPDKKDANYMQVALRNRIKLFWRPAKLKISLKEIPQHVSFMPDTDGSFCINNKSPYYLTIIQIMHWDGKSMGVQSGKPADNLLRKTTFVPPFSCLKPGNARGGVKNGQYQVIMLDDFGSRIPFIVRV